jgi:hypothetical protein
MFRMLTLIRGMGLGAGLMYFLDPDKGGRRRAMLRDQGIHAIHWLDNFVSKATRDLGNRVSGLACELAALFETAAVTDDVLVERVRSKLGRVVSHPHPIEVHAHQGTVTLSGPILASEMEHLIRAIAAVRGVRAIENHLDVHQISGDHPIRRNGMVRVGESSQLWPGTWTPGTKLLAGMAGGLLALSILRPGGAARLALSALGVGLLAKSIAADQAAREHARGQTHPRMSPSSYLTAGMSQAGSGRPGGMAGRG